MNLIRTPQFAMDLVNMPRCADGKEEREEVGMSGSCHMLIVAEGAGRLIFRPRGAKRNRVLEIRKAETLSFPPPWRLSDRGRFIRPGRFQSL
jgi:hypothetical protein